MTKKYRRTPRNYDGSAPTSHRVQDVLPTVLEKLGSVYESRPDLILASWPDVIGPRLATMTKAESFVDGVLTVKVNNSTLHSLLSQNDRPRIVKLLRQKFPKVTIRTVLFKMG